MKITVYLGASDGNAPALKQAARELGQWIGASGHSLVYGGSKSGLMGDLASSVLAAGGTVTGVEPQFFVDAGYVYDEITQLIVTQTMGERKAKMIELGDAFLPWRHRNAGGNCRGDVQGFTGAACRPLHFVQP